MTEAAVQPGLSTQRSVARLWPYVRPYRFRLAASIVLATIASCLALAMPLVLKSIVDGPVARRQPSDVIFGGLALLVLGTAEAGIFGIRRWLTAGPLAFAEATMRADFHRHVQRLPICFHDRWPKGQLLSRSTTDLQVVRMFLAGPMTFIVANSVMILAGGAILISQQWLLGLIVLATVPVLIYVSARFEIRYGAATRAAQDISGDLTTTVGESILAIRVIKGFRQDQARIARFRQQVRKSREAELSKADLLGRYLAVVMALPDVATACALMIGAVQVAHGHLSAGALLAFLATIIALRPSVAETGSLLASCHDAAASAARFFEVLDEPAAPQDKLPARGRPRATGPAELAVEGVEFRYPGTAPERPAVLRDLSLRIAPGETLAVVGATGSGKTTLAALVARMYNPVKGRITLDGADIVTLSQAELREALVVAFDEPALFSMNAADNVLMGLEAGQEDLEKALRIAHAHEFVSQLPDGARTQLGENGLTLSGGQRQRIALARAVIRKPRLLVLDDPLSALDIHTEAQVQEALREVLATTTTLVIAHRPSTVQLADRVAVLDRGQVIAIGTHDKLLETSPEYAVLMTAVVLLLQQAAALAGPVLVAYTIDSAVPALRTKDVVPLTGVTVGYVVCAIANGLLQDWFVRLSARISQNVLCGLRLMLFSKIQAQSIDFHERHSSGQLTSRATTDIEAVRELLDSGLDQIISAAVSLIYISVILLILDWQLGLAALAAMGPVYLTMRSFRRRVRKVYHGRSTAAAVVITGIAEMLGGIRTVRAYRCEEANDATLAVTNGRHRDLNIRAGLEMARYVTSSRLVANAAIAALVLWGGYQVASGQLALGAFAGAVLYLRTLYDEPLRLGGILDAYQSAAASLEKIAVLLATQPAVTEPAEPTPLPALG